MIETQQKIATINDGFPNIDSQQVKDKPNKKSRIPLIIVSLIMILLLCVGVFALYNNKIDRNEKIILPSSFPTQTTTQPTPTINPTSDWKTYKNNNFEFKYPPNFLVKSEEKITEIFSPEFLCQTGVSGTLKNININEIKIVLTTHTGKDINTVWENIFGFEFMNNYDGEINIGGKTAYYFFQGAETALGRTAYLIRTKPDEFLEINTYIPNVVTNCVKIIRSPNEYNSIINQILSTFKFVDKPKIVNVTKIPLEIPAELKCAVNEDCGINTCSCQIMNKKYIAPEGMICMRECDITPICFQKRCIAKGNENKYTIEIQ